MTKGRFEDRQKHKSFASVRKYKQIENQYRKCKNCIDGRVGKERKRICGYCKGMGVRKKPEVILPEYEKMVLEGI